MIVGLDLKVDDIVVITWDGKVVSNYDPACGFTGKVTVAGKYDFYVSASKIWVSATKSEDPNKPNDKPDPAEVEAERLDLINTMDADFSIIQVNATMDDPSMGKQSIIGTVKIGESAIDADLFAVNSDGASVLVVRANEVYAIDIVSEAELTVANIVANAKAYIAAHKTEFYYVGNLFELLSSVGGSVGMADATNPDAPVDDVPADTTGMEAMIEQIMAALGEEGLATLGDIVTTEARNLFSLIFNVYEKNDNGYVLSADLTKVAKKLWDAAYAVAEVFDTDSDITVAELYESDEFKAIADIILNGITGKQVELVLNTVKSIMGESFPIEVIAATTDQTAYDYIGKYLDIKVNDVVTVGNLDVRGIISGMINDPTVEIPVLTDVLDGFKPQFDAAVAMLAGFKAELTFDTSKKLQQIDVTAVVPVMSGAPSAPSTGVNTLDDSGVTLPEVATYSFSVSMPASAELLDLTDCYAEVENVTISSSCACEDPTEVAWMNPYADPENPGGAVPAFNIEQIYSMQYDYYVDEEGLVSISGFDPMNNGVGCMLYITQSVDKETQEIVTDGAIMYSDNEMNYYILDCDGYIANVEVLPTEDGAIVITGTVDACNVVLSADGQTIESATSILQVEIEIVWSLEMVPLFEEVAA